MIEILTKLKERREELGIGLKQAEEETRIRIDYLRAIEEGDFEYIEAEVYVRGFLKVYSGYLGLDTKEVLEAYKKLQEPEINEEEIIKKEAFKEKLLKYFDEHQNILMISCLSGIVLLVICMLIFGGFKLYDLFEPSSVDNSSPSIESNQIKEEVKAVDNQEIRVDERIKLNQEKATMEIKENTIQKDSQEEIDKKNNAKIDNKQAIADKITIQVETVDKSWYSVEVDGKVIFKGIVASNNKKTFSGRKIKVKIGNGAGVRIIKDNKVMGPFGFKGEVIVKQFSVDE